VAPRLQLPSLPSTTSNNNNKTNNNKNRNNNNNNMKQVWDVFFVVYRHLLRYDMSEMLAGGGTALNYVHINVIARGREHGMFSTAQEGVLVVLLCAH